MHNESSDFVIFFHQLRYFVREGGSGHARFISGGF